MSEDGSVDLLKRVTQRLFFFLLLFFVPPLVAATWFAEARTIVPIIVITTGCVGGFVGLQRRIKQLTPSELELIASSIFYTGLSPLVGGILALLLYVAFLSGLVSGQLFPLFYPDRWVSDTTFASIFYQHGASYQDYAKLIFWSFVAGFSERFVTDVISRFEGTAVDNALKSFQAKNATSH